MSLNDHRWRWTALLAVIVTPGLCAAQTTNLPAIEDSWLHGLSSSTPQGGGTDLAICPVADYWIYLKFDLSSLSGTVASAELRMTRFDGIRPEEISLYFISDDSWSEAALTGLNRPSPTSPLPGDALGTGSARSGHDAWGPTALSVLVQQESAGDGTITLMVREDPGAPLDVRRYYSKDAPRPDTDKPQLVVTLGPESLDPGWLTADIGSGTKPSFDFDAAGRIHVMGMTETQGGVVWHDVADGLFGPWSNTVVATGYFYGPGDLRVDPSGTAHLAWHNHDLQNPQHAAVASDGSASLYVANTPGSHDGWDNALAISPSGRLHQASINPSAFGAVNSLQYGSFTGTDWVYEAGIPGSGAAMYGLNTSLAIGQDGTPHIAYCLTSDWATPGDLRYATKTNGSWQVTTVVTGGIRGRFPSLTLDHWDRPHIAWLDIQTGDSTQGTVRYGVLNAGVWEIEAIDTLTGIRLGSSHARKSVSLALDSGGRPHVAYADAGMVKYATKPFADWQITPVLQHADAIYKGLVVLRLDATDRPGIVFWQTASLGPGLVRLARPRPVSFALRPPSTMLPSPGVTVDWSVFDGYHYTVQQRDGLPMAAWTNAVGTWPTTETQWVDPTPPTPTRHYRVLASPMP